MLVCVCVAIVGREEWSGEGRITETWEVSWIARMVLARGEVDGAGLPYQVNSFLSMASHLGSLVAD